VLDFGGPDIILMNYHGVDYEIESNVEFIQNEWVDNNRRGVTVINNELLVPVGYDGAMVVLVNQGNTNDFRTDDGLLVAPSDLIDSDTLWFRLAQP
jgi:hypothetical protein